MLFDIIIIAFQGFASNVVWILERLPKPTLPAEMTASLQQIGGYIGVIDNIIPTGTIVSIVGLVLLAEGAIMSYKVIQWVIKKIPGIS